MAEFRVRLTKSELITVYILGTFLFVELLVLMSLVHFAKFPMFIPLFIKTLKLLTPLFIVINAAFLGSIMLVKGRKLIIRSWKVYLQELSRFFTLSLMITIVLMTISAILGALFGLLLEKLGETPTLTGLFATLREWVAKNIY